MIAGRLANVMEQRHAVNEASVQMTAARPTT